VLLTPNAFITATSGVRDGNISCPRSEYPSGDALNGTARRAARCTSKDIAKVMSYRLEHHGSTEVRHMHNNEIDPATLRLIADVLMWLETVSRQPSQMHLYMRAARPVHGSSITYRAPRHTAGSVVRLASILAPRCVSMSISIS
jgi:hypothetical protein